MNKLRNGIGVGVDYRGAPVRDPTENVETLMAASLAALAQLRLADKAFNDSSAAHLKDIADLRAKHTSDMSDLRERHQHSLRVAESERLNSIRQVDREDVNKTASQALQAIQTLATTTNTTAETLRTQVATTAQAAATQLATITGEINKRISALELASSEGKGKEKVADPVMASMIEKMDRIVTLQATGGGKREGISLVGALVVGAVSVMGGLIAIAVSLYAVLKP